MSTSFFRSSRFSHGRYTSFRYLIKRYYHEATLHILAASLVATLCSFSAYSIKGISLLPTIGITLISAAYGILSDRIEKKLLSESKHLDADIALPRLLTSITNINTNAIYRFEKIEPRSTLDEDPISCVFANKPIKHYCELMFRLDSGGKVFYLLKPVRGHLHFIFNNFPGTNIVVVESIHGRSNRYRIFSKTASFFDIPECRYPHSDGFRRNGFS